MSRESLKRAVDMAGGQAHLARGIRDRLRESKVGQVHVWGWLNAAKFEVPPAETVLAIADFLDYRITPHELRPDLYPNPGDALPLTPALEQKPDTAFGGFGDRRQEDRRPDCSDDHPHEAEAA